ncbi:MULTISPECIES: class I SAM-dependent methyltransferase [Frankia]|uniref:class I SAM-dependent methyltransferase n=1 Tax=Frankia TaxID=1854 RepID=UPI00068D4EE4|nr:MULTISPECIES: class I SAM-dependent methyltransferase [Frankia]ORT93268.1 hypothetical protein UK99_19940 [Frankia casuarinae]
MKDSGFVAAFNASAETYDKRHGATCGLAHQLAVAAVTERVMKPAAVVDVGCGTGALLGSVSRSWPQARLVGVDPAQRMIEVARRRLPQADLWVATAERLPLADGSVDLVVSTTAFNHWADHEQALREAGRVLSPDGLIVVVEHAPPGHLIGLLLRLNGRMVRHHSESDIADLTWASGLRPLSITAEPDGFVRLVARPDRTPRRKEAS